MGRQLYEVAEDGNVTDIGVNTPESRGRLELPEGEHPRDLAPASWDFRPTYGNMNAGFKAGTIMCVMNGPWQVADHLTGEAFADPTNLIIAPIPEGTGGNTGSPVGGHNYVVYALVGEDPDKQAAVAAATYITAPSRRPSLPRAWACCRLATPPTRNEAVASDPIISLWDEVMQKATNRAGLRTSGHLRLLQQQYQSFIKGDKTARRRSPLRGSTWRRSSRTS